MLSSLDPSSQQFLNDIGRISDRLERAQRQISSGRRVNLISDEPDQVSTLLLTRASLAGQQQIQFNLGRVKTETDTAEQTLQTAVLHFDRVQTLGALGASNLQTAEQRAEIAQDLGNLLGQIVGLAGTKVEGRHLFSGDTDQVAPYDFDATLASPVSVYQGSAATRVVQHPNGGTFAVSRSAQEIFDAADPADNVFASVNNLRTALLANDDAAISTALNALPRAAAYLNGQLAFYGNTQNTVTGATEFGLQLGLQFETRLAELQDADLSTAALELTEANLQLQASLQARAQLPRSSLFSLLG